MSERELWSAARIAKEFGWSGGAATARKWLHRHGIEHVTTTGPRDTRLYDPAEVRRVRADPDASPGRGRRTDLQRKAEEKP